MIELTNVTYCYSGSELPAVVDLTLEVPRSSFVLLFGGSRSGKSTVCKLVSRELIPQSGELRVQGKDVARLKPGELAAYRRGLGLVLPDLEIFLDRTVRQNLEIVFELRGERRARASERTEQILDRYDLRQNASKRAGSLSKSERQRLAVARAVLAEPFVLIADEPTAQLDPAGMRTILDHLRDEHLRGMTILLATSDERIPALLPEATVFALQSPALA